VITKDVHFLALHEPYTSPQHPVPINATIVHALTLLHPMVPQPDGGMIFRCLTEFPDRKPGCVVPMSTLTFELDGGRLWPQIGDWEAVTHAVASLAQKQYCDALSLGLGPRAQTLLANGPQTEVTFHNGKSSELAGRYERQAELDDLEQRVSEFVMRGPFFPGNDLVKPPTNPRSLPYRPYGTTR
jgi:hypothetical protein